MANLQDQSLQGGPLPRKVADVWPGSVFYEPNAVKAIQQKVDMLAAHMQKQLSEHEAAMRNTHQVFDYLLQDMENFVECFQSAFEARHLEGKEAQLPRIRSQMDPDRSVGILQILWHAISFTTRGNTKPLALNRPGRPPVFTGRIIALNGDFLDTRSNLHAASFSELIHQEIASLYIPADPTAPAVMSMKHLSGEEIYFHQADAPRRFLLKVVEIVCGGGFFHEQ
ncbi:hypothetical protein [Vampirovibrio chlorellavorus]|uniref:hypothetical protein n=1 Tax=Vampirovibrio chlorellavorus TaxID=758823 RepID=UPI0026EFF082|nr:hypothetical protein [Vampirovibrio chlorellavorus]